jgi:hypothetical protein
MAPTKPATDVPLYQMRVTLEDSPVPIWRRFLVRSDVTLAKLHRILQIVMGWTDSHLHEFIVGERSYGVPDPDYADYKVMHDERWAKLGQKAPAVDAEFRYLYDFGDGWEHRLVVEGIVPPEPGRRHAECLAGEGACPPEDVGGVWGYGQCLEALADPDDPEHEEYVVWTGGEFDPMLFDLEEVNELLRWLR